MTEQEIAAAFEMLLGYPPRSADLALLRVICPSGVTVADLADYIWDHHLGEPDEPSLEQVEAVICDCITRANRCA